MTRYILGRLFQVLITFLLFQTVVFFLLHAQPGDITDQFLSNPRIPPEARQVLRAQLGLDKPLGEQYLTYLKNFWTGDMGVSWTRYPRPVTDIIAETMPRTLVLFISSTVVSFGLGFWLGRLLAWKRGALIEYPVTLVSIFLYTVFYPWFALVIIWLFAFRMKLFPIGKFIDVRLWRGSQVPYTANEVFNHMVLITSILVVVLGALYYFTRNLSPIDRRRIRLPGTVVALVAFIIYWVTSPMSKYASDIAWHMVLPILTLTAVGFAGTMLLTRNSMLETLREDYILTARAKGLPEKVVRDNHAARNALLPVVTSLVYSLAATIGGGIITETYFSWPGMGLILLEASTRSDIPLAIGALTFVGVLALVAHFVADITYAFLDPRIRY